MAEEELTVASKLVEADLSSKVKKLEDELRQAKIALKQVRGSITSTSISSVEPTSIGGIMTVTVDSNGRSPADGSAAGVTGDSALRGSARSERSSLRSNTIATTKRGYLFKWQDRTIGWGGTKWALRFVSLERGRLMYYGSHHDVEPRYELVLRGCAVRDDGYKRNKRHQSISSKNGEVPPISESGAYFHVFSIYQRRDDEDDFTYLGDDDDDVLGRNSVSLHSHEIIPLLRFSTPSMAEKMQWMSLISETCAYCETDAFLDEEVLIMEERQRRREEHLAMTKAMPQAERGTLPPLYFAPAPPKKLKRTSSGTKLLSFQTKSNTRDADRVDARSTKGYPPSKPMHREAAPSYLSEEAPVQNYRGILNLAVILLVVSNARLLLESYNTYGELFWTTLSEISSFTASENNLAEFPFLSGFVLLAVACLNGFFIEWFLSRGVLGNTVGAVLHQVNAHGILMITTAIVWTYIDTPAAGATLLFHGVIVWMKLISYALANEDYRTSDDRETNKALLALVKDLDPGAAEVTYPKNITLSNMIYFLFAPTLTYQIVFPRSPRIRIYIVISLIIRLFIVAALMFFLTAQVITPYLQSLARDLETTGGRFTVDILAEYALRLSIANMYCWLLMFYGFFHLYLNLTGELLRFGDRIFYRDWWNSSEVSAYWRLWNSPVHYWLVRHVFFPCVRLGMSKTVATFAVFFLSAVVHELLISTPFHMVRPWIYMGMMGQIPLVWITKAMNKRLPGSSLSNICFWLAFFVGQPMCVLLYTIDYQAKKMGSSWVIENKYCWASLIGNPCETTVASATTAITGNEL